MNDWREIEDDREKYAAYLCGREWSEKRELVRQRCSGKCERCKWLHMDHVHHLTYARKYAESLDDLQAVCSSCHKFIHGKSSFNPEAVSVFDMDWKGSFLKTLCQDEAFRNAVREVLSGR